MLHIPQHKIDQAASENAGLSITEISAFKRGVQWALEEMSPKKHTNKANFILVSELGRNTQRMEDGDMIMWLMTDKAQATEVLAIRFPQYPASVIVKSFLEHRCGDKFNDTQHLFNALRRFWEGYKPEEQKAKPISRKQINTDSFVDEQLRKKK